MRAALCTAVAVALLGGCKERKAVEAPVADAGPAQAREFAAEDLGIELELAPGWKRTAQEGAATRLHAERQPGDGPPFFVPPKLILRVDPVETWQDVEVLSREAIDGLRQLEKAGQLELRRSSTARRHVNGVEIGDVEVEYAVPAGQGGRERAVVMRGLVTRRETGGKPFGVTLQATYMAEDDERLVGEVVAMLRSLRFKATAPVDPDAPVAVPKEPTPP